MAYVRKKKINGGEYYYLVEGYRDDREPSKVRQRVIRYLGKHDSIEAARASLAASEAVVPKDEEQDYIVELERLSAEWSSAGTEYRLNTRNFEYDGMGWSRAVAEWRGIDKRTKAARMLGARLAEASAPQELKDDARDRAAAIYDALPSQADKDRAYKRVGLIRHIVSNRELRAWLEGLF